MQDFQVVVFSLNNQIFGVDASQITEIISIGDLLDHSRKSELIEGVINFRGNDISVVSMNRIIGLGNDEITHDTKIIVTNSQGILLGFIVNDVFEISEADKENVKNIPELVINESNRYLEYLYIDEKRMFYIINFNNILSRDEIEEISLENSVEKGEKIYE